MEKLCLKGVWLLNKRNRPLYRWMNKINVLINSNVSRWIDHVKLTAVQAQGQAVWRSHAQFARADSNPNCTIPIFYSFYFRTLFFLLQWWKANKYNICFAVECRLQTKRSEAVIIRLYSVLKGITCSLFIECSRHMYDNDDDQNNIITLCLCVGVSISLSLPHSLYMLHFCLFFSMFSGFFMSYPLVLSSQYEHIMYSIRG